MNVSPKHQVRSKSIVSSSCLQPSRAHIGGVADSTPGPPSLQATSKVYPFLPGSAKQGNVLAALTTNRNQRRGVQQLATVESPDTAFQLQYGESSSSDVNAASDTHLGLPQEAFQGTNQYVPSPVDTHIIVHGLKTIAAFHVNALMLHIDCSVPQPLPLEVWRFPDITVPSTLAPTDLQMRLTPHPPFMDLLPFACFRDGLLKARAVIDPLEFWSDLTSGGVKVWGRSPWEKRGWEVDVGFAKKWPWLISYELLEETNFWRAARGEDLMVMDLVQ